MAVCADYRKVAESSDRLLEEVGQRLEMMYMGVSHAQGSIDCCEVEATSWNFATKSAMAPQGFGDLPVAQLTLPPPMRHETNEPFALNPKQLVRSRI